MLSYIASNPMEDLIKGVCEELNITILSKIGEIDFLQYIKETKVNFKLIKYIIIELKSLKINICDKETIKSFEINVKPIMERIANNSLENKKLAELRDTLLPKLMNEEIDLEKIKI